jgi:hypothetical protein
MMSFWAKEAYEIAYKITRGNELHSDLVSHVYILLQKYDLTEEELPKTFAKFAYNQWNWRESDFNRSFKSPQNIEISEFIPAKEEDESPSEAQNIFRGYLDQSPTDDNELFCKEIAKMYICGMTYREIRSETGISLDMINKALKKFKHDVLNSSHSSRILQSINDSPSSRC